MIELKTISQRTVEENRYYWGVVVAKIAEHMKINGMTAHEFIKLAFKVESTATLTTQEFEELMENIRTRCLKLWSLKIPLPNQ